VQAGTPAGRVHKGRGHELRVHRNPVSGPRSGRVSNQTSRGKHPTRGRLQSWSLCVERPPPNGYQAFFTRAGEVAFATIGGRHLACIRIRKQRRKGGYVQKRAARLSTSDRRACKNVPSPRGARYASRQCSFCWHSGWSGPYWALTRAAGAP